MAKFESLLQPSAIGASWRFCVNYGALNKQTILKKYPIPIIHDILFFSVLLRSLCINDCSPR